MRARTTSMTSVGSSAHRGKYISRVWDRWPYSRRNASSFSLKSLIRSSVLIVRSACPASPAVSTERTASSLWAARASLAMAMFVFRVLLSSRPDISLE
jgi:hypothetical protein